jgi:RNA polymerase sigma-70 factor (ECF subfamily)
VEELTDDQALQKAALGNKEAFGILYERYVARIYNYIYYRTGLTTEAEDLTAKVFFRAYNHIGSYRNTGVPFSAWLYRIAHNLVANWHRDNSRNKEVALEDEPQIIQRGDLPESSVMKDQQVDSLFSIIRGLTADRQQLLILKFVEQYSNADIGIIMGRSEGAIKSLYHRTLYNLKDELEDIEM